MSMPTLFSVLFIKIYLFSQLSLIKCDDFNGVFSSSPDIFRDTPQFIESRNFKYTAHKVTTEDGYILTVFRLINPYLPKNKRRPRPLFIQHGLWESSDGWLRNRPGKLDNKGRYSEVIGNKTVVNNCKDQLTSTMGFTLSACGWDVWLGNTRGTSYSQNHVNLTVLDIKFWDYTIDDLGLYDVTASVDYVLKQTNQKSLNFIGHSLGGSQSLALLSLRPEWGEKLRPYIGLGAVGYMSHIRSVLRFAAPPEPIVRPFTVPIGLPVPIAQLWGAYVCGDVVFRDFCQLITDLLWGRDPINADITRTAVDQANYYDFTSSRILLHYAQFINDGTFGFFNHGLIKNRQLYGQDRAPDYPLKDITARDMYLIQADNDLISDPRDNERLARQIKCNKMLTD